MPQFLARMTAPVLGAHDERARGDRLGGIPHKFGADGVAVGGI